MQIKILQNFQTFSKDCYIWCINKIEWVREKNLRSKKSKFSLRYRLVSIFVTNDNGNTKMRPGSVIINKIKFCIFLSVGSEPGRKLNGLLPI